MDLVAKFSVKRQMRISNFLSVISVALLKGTLRRFTKNNGVKVGSNWEVLDKHSLTVYLWDAKVWRVYPTALTSRGTIDQSSEEEKP